MTAKNFKKHVDKVVKKIFKEVKKPVIKNASKKKVTKPVEIVYIVDRSGSMSSIIDDAIGGFNTSLKAQKALPGKANMTLVLFDDQYELPQYRTVLKEAKELDRTTFVPRGMTALNDAIGRTITDFMKLKNEGKIDKAIFCILTDGEENHSIEFRDTNKIKSLIKQATDENKWEFLYLAANQDAFAVGTKNYGFQGYQTRGFVADAIGTKTAYTSMSATMGAFRGGVDIATASGGVADFDIDKLNSLIDKKAK